MTILLVLPAVLGVLVAGVTNYLADQLPKTGRLSAVKCPRCGAERIWVEHLFPSRCRQCGGAPGTRRWIIAAAMVILSLFIWLRPLALGYPLGLLVLTYLAVVVVIDVEHRLILRTTSLFGVPLALGIGWRLHGLAATLAGGFAGLVIMGAFYHLGRWFKRRKARRIEAAGGSLGDEEALGAGDVTLAAILGLLLGWPLIWFDLLLGALLAGAVGLMIVLVYVLRNQGARTAMTAYMPLGPCLVLGAFLILYLPDLVAIFLP
jgi:prepilin signal peptidase PulO-like enzyme (type II secretory pathway)